MATHRTAQRFPCPSCNAPLDAATNASEEEVCPSPGDASVCSYCGAPLMFCDDMSLRIISRKEFMQLPAELQAVMVKAIMIVAFVQSKQRRGTLH